ncbi:hypothetical protein BC833DRAFT_610613 [Globomyces pollinis-pini]|nr:hypothetical protein BC833DRAFT_610613 [Globomyces pollinis-pini]
MDLKSILGSSSTHPIILSLHFVLLKLNLSKFYSTFLLALCCVVIPLYVSNLGFMKGGPFFPTLTRISSIGTLSEETKDWTIKDYITYYYTFDSTKNRKHLRKKYKRLLKEDPNNAQALNYFARSSVIHNKSISYHAKLLAHILFNTILVCSVGYYLHYYEADWKPRSWTLLDLTDLNLVKNNVIFGIGLFAMINISHSFWGYLVALVFKCPYYFAMNYPFFATSLQDFWGNRCKLNSQTFLKRLAYDIVLKFFGYTKESKKKPPKSIKLLGFIGTFFLSGILHEYLLLVMGFETHLEQLGFFMLHSMLVILEGLVVDFIYNITGYHLIRDSPWIVKVVYTNLVLLYTSPLMFNAYLTGGMYTELVLDQLQL